MENPKFDPQTEHKLVGQKLLLGEVLSDYESDMVFKSATDFTSSLVDKVKSSFPGIALKSDEVRKHLSIVILDRLSASIENILTEDLKRSICEVFFIDPNSFSNLKLNNILTPCLDRYFDQEVGYDVKTSMDFISNSAKQVIVANTPIKK